MTTPTKRGIVDPWRVVEPLQPKPVIRPSNRKINPGDNMDDDLLPEEFFVFTSVHGSIEVRSKRIASTNDALRELIKCLFQILEWDDGPALFEDASVGFELGEREWLRPAVAVPASKLTAGKDYTPSCTLWFVNQSYDEGMLRLLRVLMMPRCRDVLLPWGVRPTMR